MYCMGVILYYKKNNTIYYIIILIYYSFACLYLISSYNNCLHNFLTPVIYQYVELISTNFLCIYFGLYYWYLCQIYLHIYSTNIHLHAFYLFQLIINVAISLQCSKTFSLICLFSIIIFIFSLLTFN